MYTASTLKSFTKFPYTAYTWVNGLYLNDKQYGIQSAHCISDMSLSSYGKDIYTEWASKHKTIIVFNGTNSGTIKRVFDIIQYTVRNLNKIGVEIPHAIFREDTESLDGATTACGFIIPDYFRQFDWTSIPDSKSSIVNQFLPGSYALDIQEPWECTTNEYHKYVTYRDGIHISYKDYEYDNFNLAEFGDWMKRQRLA